MLLPTNEASKYLGRSQSSLLNHVRLGNIEAITPGENYRSGYLFDTDELDRLKRVLGIDRSGTITVKEIVAIYLVDRGREFTPPGKRFVRLKLKEFEIEPVGVAKPGTRLYDRGRVLVEFDEIWFRRDQL